MSRSGDVAAVETSDRTPPSDDTRLLELRPRPVAVELVGRSNDRRAESSETAGVSGARAESVVNEVEEGRLRKRDGSETGGFERDADGGESGVTAFGPRGGEGEGDAEPGSAGPSMLDLPVEPAEALLAELAVLEVVEIEVVIKLDVGLSEFPSAPLLALLDLLLASRPVSVADSRLRDLLAERFERVEPPCKFGDVTGEGEPADWGDRALPPGVKDDAGVLGVGGPIASSVATVRVGSIGVEVGERMASGR